MPRAWKAEKRFILDCPICREPAIPRRTDVNAESPDYRMVHPNRVATCFVKGDSDAAEPIRTLFNEWFGTNDASIATQTRTGRLSDDSIDAEWSQTYTGRINSAQYKAIENWVYASMAQVDDWENEGGACAYTRE
jgi:hypothetical protein